MITLATLCDPDARAALEATTARYSKMPPQQAKWFLNQMHLHGKIDAAELGYWLDFLNIDPSL